MSTAFDNERVLVVEDDEQISRSVCRLLERRGFRCDVAGDAAEARARLALTDYALVLSDVNLPGESGLDLARDLLAGADDVAVVMVTGLDDADLAREALELGTYGYVIKPFKPNELVINVSNALRRRLLELESRRHREMLELIVQERTLELQEAVASLASAQEDLTLAHEEMIQRLSQAAESRDGDTGSHIARVSQYAALLARRLELSDEECELIRLAAPLHDVGKIAIPDHVLLKPGTLTPGERRVMERHAELGHRILSGSRAALLEKAASVAITHHERFDGSGYPCGLRGEEIPIEGRVLAVVDVFDALTNDRVYRPAFPLDAALQIMREARGSHFDPVVLDVFLESLDDILAETTEPPAIVVEHAA